MVLDEASPAASDTLPSESTPSTFDSDQDAISDRVANYVQLPPTVDLSTLARPVPVYGPLTGYNDETLKQMAEMEGTKVANILQRPLSHPEWEAIAFHMAKFQSYRSYGWPVGFVLSTWRWYSTMDQMRFPFWKPKDVVHKFDSFGSLRGQAARRAWHAVRFTFYGGAIAAPVKMGFSFYALNVMVMGQRVDQRLRAFWELLKDLDKDELKRRIASSAWMNEERPPGPQTGSDIRQKRLQQRGASEWEKRRAAAARGELPGGTAEGVQRSDQIQSSPESTQGQFMQDFESDDASPMARDVSSEPSPATPGNAWDRVRRGDAVSSPAAARRTPEGSTQGDTWYNIRRGRTGQDTQEGSQESTSFSSSDADKQLAREQAQRDFDDRMERERQGGNFNDSPFGRGRS